ncbi:MAG: class I SAM-dependent methyltransferase [Oculatellaceae cyanobacterium Prado106]|jgi:SAM-dependent methyltransferase|nr:class I SAM-dependent methyltransferase [Oculatellaceae cyanobacterium Prado106]
MNWQRFVIRGLAGLGIAGMIASCNAQSDVQATNPANSTVAQSSPSQTSAPDLDVPYVPTPQAVVDRMLQLANVTANDVVYDLGSGDGRIPITAVQKYGVQEAVGVDIDPERVREANQNAQEAGVSDRVEFRQQDLFQTDLQNASVVTLYLLPDVNLKLRPKLLSELRPGTRIVSHSFDMGDWQPEQTVEVEGRTLYLWTVPETIPENLRS